MTVALQGNNVVLQGNGVTTAFPYPFWIQRPGDVKVYLRDDSDGSEVEIPPASYSITGVSTTLAAGGSVTYPLVGSPISSDFSIIIDRQVPLTQDLDVTNQSGFFPATIEFQLDRMEMQIQQLDDSLNRGLQVPIGDAGMIIDLIDDGHFWVMDNGRAVDGGDAGDFSNVAALAAQVAADADAVAAALLIFQGGGISAAVADIPALKALDPAGQVQAIVRDANRGGVFTYSAADQSASMVIKSRTSLAVAGNTFSMRSVLTTSVDSGTETLTKAAHGFVNDELVTVTASVDGLVAGGNYYIFNVTANTFQLRTSLTAGAVNLTGTTNITVRGQHGFTTGQAVIASAASNGLSTNTLYYVIRVNECDWQLASTPQNAMAGTPIVLSGSVNLTFKHIADPTEMRWVVKSTALKDGSQGAWLRQGSKLLNVQHGGAVPGAESWYPIQAAIWFSAFCKSPVYIPGGTSPYVSSYSLRYHTADKLAQALQGDSVLKRDNGLTILGDGPEVSVIRCSATFPNTTHLLNFDGNQNGVVALVGSNPYAQGTNIISGVGFQGRGSLVGTAVKGFGFCGVWGLRVDNCEWVGFSGDTIEHFSYTPAASGLDDLDSSAYIFFRNFRLLSGGGHGFSCVIARPATLHLENFEIENMTGCGFVGGPIAASFRAGIISACGARAAVTTGGMRLINAASSTGLSSICRNVQIENVTFENNFNFEINPQQVIGLVVTGGAYNVFEPTGGVVANKAVFRVGANVTRMTVIGGYFQDYSAPTDGGIYDVPYFNIASGALDVTIRNAIFLHTTGHVILQTGVRFIIEGMDVLDISFTGTQPLDSFWNRVSLGTQTFVPTVIGTTAAGVGTYSTQLGTYRKITPNLVEFEILLIWTAHTGTGNMKVGPLPFTAVVNTPVQLYYSDLTYTSPPQALIVGASTDIVLRQAATGAAFSALAMDVAATLHIAGTYRI